ncbi:MAG: hypothetical protein BWY75_02389 [bacterium ADurb.Bin425]|nr:MAG: hypothetical protein BWY75_02389 [bacterium ADurb.Bin425]
MKQKIIGYTLYWTNRNLKGRTSVLVGILTTHFPDLNKMSNIGSVNIKKTINICSGNLPISDILSEVGIKRLRQ